MSLALWRDVALVWLALLCFIGMVAPLAVALFAVKGAGLVLDRAPELLGKVQRVTRLLRDQTDTGNRQVVTHFMAAQRQVHRVTTAVQRLTGGLTAPVKSE